MRTLFAIFVLSVAVDAEIGIPGVLSGDPLARLGVKKSDFASKPGQVRFVGKTRYLNNLRAVVTHTIDDSTKYAPHAIDAMDKYGIKATIFVSTELEPISQLWPRLRKAITDGHEIGAHSRRHQCKWPDTREFCQQAYSDYEISGSRDDILKNTSQTYVLSWCFPCGNCASYHFVQERLARAGYIVARNYPGELEDGHLVPDLQTWDMNFYNATYTQVAQKGGSAKLTEDKRVVISGRTNVQILNAKFNEIYERGGIYNLMSHPQSLDFGTDGFYEQHLKHISGHKDVWYVPMGPLYAYKTMWDRTQVRELEDGSFIIYNDLDPKIYNGSLTLEFARDGDRAPIFTTVKPNTIIRVHEFASVVMQ